MILELQQAIDITYDIQPKLIPTHRKAIIGLRARLQLIKTNGKIDEDQTVNDIIAKVEMIRYTINCLEKIPLGLSYIAGLIKELDSIPTGRF